MRSMTEKEFNDGFAWHRVITPTFAVGDKVFIHDKSHPAARQTGTVVVAPREVDGIVKGLWAEVEIDGMAGHRCGVQPRQMRKLA